MAENYRKVKDIGTNFPKGKPTTQYKQSIGPSTRSETYKERLAGFIGNIVNKPSPKRHEHHERRERNTRHERSESVEWEREEHRRRPTRTVVHYYDETPTRPRKKKRRQAPRSSGGGFGSGLDMRDFIPSNMGLGQAMGYTPTRKKRRGTRSGAGNWTDPGYIPESLRGFF